MRRKAYGQRGQTLVFVAVLLVGLRAMLALILDGGTAHLERRHMQNAEDCRLQDHGRKDSGNPKCIKGSFQYAFVPGPRGGISDGGVRAIGLT